MDESNRGSVESAWHFAFLGLAMFLVLVVAVVFVARSYATTPIVGDIVALRPGSPDPLGESLVAVRLNGAGVRGGACALRTDLIAKGGGSLVVEARRLGPTPSYTVHWAGGSTSPDAGDCGRSADLELTSSEIALLAQIAGGYGPQPHDPGRNIAALSAPLW